MTRKIDPKSFGLHPSTRIEEHNENSYTLVIQRKSRIIMKDGHQIQTKVAKIKEKTGGAEVDVRTTAPVCSKTEAFLKELGIMIKHESPDSH